MVWNYSDFLPPAPGGGTTGAPLSPLQILGWQPFFSQQISVAELEQTPPARVTEIHRNALVLVGDGIRAAITPSAEVTVGDWVLYDADRHRAHRILARKSLLRRRAPGRDRQIQLIAANIDTAFIVSSCNDDFNVARLERYVALALQAEIEPVIVLTKSDLVTSTDCFADRARSISATVPVLVLDARGDAPRSRLADWCKPGRTVAFLGSSGVGKSTLTNALAGGDLAATQAIRDDDAKGRHTTTRRHLHVIPDRGLVLDTPGMRELQLTDAASGVDEVFADLHDLATQCRFNDCRHDTEPGCAVKAAIASGTIDPARLRRWRKLKAEDAFNSASLAERRSKDKALGKTIRQIVKSSRK